MSLPSLKAVVVFTAHPLDSEQRNRLWRQFGVPCFEQMLDENGRVAAEECEVHAGLHVLRTGFGAGALTSDECDCGRTEPRLFVPPMR